jgi:hypothetical protein
VLQRGHAVNGALTKTYRRSHESERTSG